MTNDEIWELIKIAPFATEEQIRAKIEYDCYSDMVAQYDE